MVVFNINALLQAIILGLIVGIIYLINPDAESIWVAYIPFFAVILTYSSGLKGKLFWIIPTWLIAVGTMFVFLKEHFHEDTTSNSIYIILNYIMLLYVSYRMFFADSRAFKKDFLKADLVLKNMNKTDDYFENNKKEFWAQISHTFVRPSFFYKKLNSVYNFVFRTNISQKEFVKHNLFLVQTIKNRLSLSSNTDRIIGIESFLQRNKEGHDLNYDFLEELAKIIDYEVKWFCRED
ncbi:hypothetical protein [Flavobacterium sp.]|uniref:hypothetical protein n=1 Tax=Flavobacterium sp. TaxID=239 RepID=UPI00261E986D|nr:hypothetical protein [Flavobacterium sp.]